MSPGPLSSALNQLAALLETSSSSPWGPPAGVSADELIALLESSPPTDATYQKVLDKLATVPWPRLWEVAAGLGKKGPGLETATYLQLVEEAGNRLPNPDPRAAVALTVTLLAERKMTLTANELELLDRLVRRLAWLDGESQWQVAQRLGIKLDEAEGMLAAIMADATALGLPDIPAPLLALIGNMDFGEWDKKGDMPWGLYIGTAVHEIIADLSYRPYHLPPAHHVWRNYDSVETILKELKQELDKEGFKFDPAPIRAAFKYVKPDIFDLSMAHANPTVDPPGWVYEIKPYRLRAIAEREVNMYASVLILAGVPAHQGPTNAQGVSGARPAPNGWVVFTSPVEGVIGYWYIEAPRDKIRERDSAKGRETAKPAREEAVKAVAAAAGLALVSTLAIALLIELLEEAGWIVVLP
jgi:hypothetical protein